MTYLLSDQDTRGTKELVSVLRSGQVTNLPFCAFFPLFPTHQLMVCGGGRDLLCRTETSVGERQPGAGGQRSHASLWDLVFETISSVSAGTHAWESRKGLLGTDVWIIAAVNRDFPCTWVSGGGES